MGPLTTIHLNYAGGTVRRAMLHNREHIVAPLVLIVPGVLEGSRGALYYPPEEVERDPSVWNHVPIVVYHPYLNGQPTSARDPEILNRQGIGVILNTHINNGRLVAEGWFDAERTRQIDQRVWQALQAGQAMELSTGLALQEQQAPANSVHNGKPYTAIATNYKPDHLAVLPDQTGACSIKDGCGVLVNEKQQQETVSLLQKLAGLLGLGKSVPTAIAPAISSTNYKTSLTANETDLKEMLRELEQAFGKAYPIVVDGNTGTYLSCPHLEEVYDDYLIYCDGDGYYKLSYSMKGAEVVFDGTPQPVERQVNYVPSSGTTTMSMNKEQRQQAIEYITANCDCWKFDKAADTLNSMPDDNLTKLQSVVQVEVANKAKPQPTVNPVQQAAQQGFSNGNTAPLPVAQPAPTANGLTEQERADLAFLRQQVANTRTEVISKITANASNKFSKEQLEAMPLDTLNNIAALAAPVVLGQQGQALPPLTLLNFGGAAVPAAGDVTQNKANTEEEGWNLPSETADWSKVS